MTWRLYKPSPRGEDCDTRIPSSKKAAKPPPHGLPFALKKESQTGLLFYSFTNTFSIAPMYMVWKFPASFPSYQRFSIDGSRKVLSSSFV